MKHLALAAALLLASCAHGKHHAAPQSGAPLHERSMGAERFDFSPGGTTTTTTAPVVPMTAAPPVTAAVEPEPEVRPLAQSKPVRAVGDCGGWGDLIAAYFPGEVDTACRVFIGCESKGNPNAVSATGDHGLAQINEATWNKPGHHDPVADWIGRHWHSVYDPATNLEMARRIRAAYGWQMWSCY